MRRSVVSLHVSDQTVEDAFEDRELLLRDAGPEPLVEGHRGCAQLKEHVLTGTSQFDYVNSTVGGVTASGDQPAGVHGVEVMGERGLPDPDRLGQLPLIGGASDLQVEQDQPLRQGPPGLSERLVERPPHYAGGARQTKPDRRLNGRRHLVRLALCLDLKVFDIEGLVLYASPEVATIRKEIKISEHINAFLSDWTAAELAGEEQ